MLRNGICSPSAFDLLSCIAVIVSHNLSNRSHSWVSETYDTGSPVCFATDIVIDAIDSLNPKVSLLSLLCSNKIPVVSSLGAARKTNPANVIVGDISEVSVCRLGMRVRKRLRKEGIYCGIRCVYSIEELEAVSVKTGNGGEEIFRRGRERIPFGSMVFVPAAFGIRLAYEVYRFITNGKKFVDE